MGCIAFSSEQSTKFELATLGAITTPVALPCVMWRVLIHLCMRSLAEILRKAPMWYPLKCREKLNHLLFMDDLKIYGKNEHEVSALSSTIELFSTDTGTEFGVRSVVHLFYKEEK